MIGQGEWRRTRWGRRVWHQHDEWSVQLRYVATDESSPLGDQGYFEVGTGDEDGFFGCAVTDLSASEVLRAVDAGWISLLAEPERLVAVRYELRRLAGDERARAWAAYGWDELLPDLPS